jgi:hypothetical protein
MSMPRTGEIGEQIFEQVEKLVSEEGLKRQEAFQRISQESGRRAGTVAANYYRVARKRGGGSVRSRSTTSRSTASSTRTRRARRDGSDMTRLADELVANVQALAAAVVEQQHQTRELEQRLEAVRSALRA